jgi:hypothetical protein
MFVMDITMKNLLIKFSLPLILVIAHQFALAENNTALCKEKATSVRDAILQKNSGTATPTEIKGLIDLIAGYSRQKITVQSINNSAQAKDLYLIAKLLKKGAFVSAQEIAKSNPALKSDVAGAATIAFLDAIYAPMSDVLTSEDAEFAAAINTAKKKVSAAQRVLGSLWNQNGVESYIRGITYNDTIAKEAGMNAMCGALKPTDIEKVVKVGKYAAIE